MITITLPSLENSRSHGSRSPTNRGEPHAGTAGVSMLHLLHLGQPHETMGPLVWIRGVPDVAGGFTTMKSL